MNENKRLLVVFGAIIVIVGIILLISFWPKPDKSFACKIKADGDYDKLGKVDYKQYQCLYETSQKNALVVADKLSSTDKNNLNKIATKLGHVLYYLDTEKISKDDLKAIKKELNYKDKDTFKDDVMLVIKDSKIDTYKENILSNSDDTYNFLKEAKLAKFACDVKTSEEYENVGDITYEQYQCLYDSEEPFVLVLEQTTCGYCQKFNPVINEYAGTNNLPIYTIQIDTLEQADKEALTQSLSYFQTNTNWGTPLSLAISKKEVVHDISGFTESEDDLDTLYSSVGLK